MVYELKENILLIEIDRTVIVDISPGDVLQPGCLPSASYTWTEQDSQFMESNPDARIFIKFEKNEENQFHGIGVMVVPQEVY